MTFLFAADVATVILPIALGASVLHQVFAAQHTAIYVAEARVPDRAKRDMGCFEPASPMGPQPTRGAQRRYTGIIPQAPGQQPWGAVTLPTSFTHISSIRRAVPFISQRETYNVGLIT
jgi:hypothetical protein